MSKIIIAATLIALAAATAAQAQTAPDKRLDRVESRLDKLEPRTPISVRAGPPAEVKPWEVSVTVPFTFNSNVANAEVGHQQAFHADPSLTVGRAWSFNGGEFFIEGNADIDAYTSHHENDNSTVSGQAGFRFGDPTQAFAPYVHYTFLSLYTGQFDSHDVTIHHFTIGAKRKIPAGKGSVTFDVNALRREASLKAVEQVRGTISATYSQDLNEELGWSLGARTQYARYTGSTSKGREDITLRVLTGLSYALSSQISLDLQGSFQRNWSDRVGKSYSVWDFGPSLGLTANF